MLLAVRPVCTACKWVVMGVGRGRGLGSSDSGIGYTTFLGSVGFGFWRLNQRGHRFSFAQDWICAVACQEHYSSVYNCYNAFFHKYMKCIASSGFH